MFPNNDPSITLSYMHNYSYVHAYAHCCIAQEDPLYTSYIDWKQLTYCSFHRFFSTRSFQPGPNFQPTIIIKLWPANITSLFSQRFSGIQQGIAGPPGPVQQHHADGYLHRRRAGRHLAARAAVCRGNGWTPVGAKHGGCFFFGGWTKMKETKNMENMEKNWKTGKERWLSWIYWLIMTVYWIEAVSKW